MICAKKGGARRGCRRGLPALRAPRGTACPRRAGDRTPEVDCTGSRPARIEPVPALQEACVEFVLLLRSALVLLGPAARRLPLRHRGLCSARRREQEFAARTSAVLAAATEPPLARTGTTSAPRLLPVQGTTVSAKARAARGRRACAQPRSAAAPAARAARFVLHSRGALSERSSRSERSELRRASRCWSIAGHPPRSGGQAPVRRPRAARAFARATHRTSRPAHAQWSH